MKKTNLLFLIVVLLVNIAPVQGKVIHLLPKPQQVETNASAGDFALQREVRVSDPTNSSALTRFLVETNCTVSNKGTAPVIEVTLVNSIAGAYDYTLSGYDNEAYTIAVEADKISITAISSTGVIRAAQTLTQLAEGYEGATPAIEAVNITDWPAFKLRGFMHDVGRSFLSVDEIKKEIDLFARFKVNTFHFHLTENQAWRFEVEQYPQLTASSSMTRFAGSYYTQAQCREIEEYAAERGVIVIPEIDMPGHSDAFDRAMGYGMQTSQGVTALQNILEEVAEVFTRAPYIHIGADEETITYTNFLQTMTDKIHSLGKKAVCWNPISGVTISSSTGFDMTQMWSSSGKKIAGLPNIDCRYNYINHFDVYADLVGIYKSNIYYVEQGSSEVAGTITAVWNDRKTPTEEDIIKQNNVYANTLASAERAWTGGGEQYIETGGTTLPNSGSVFNEFVDWERRFLFHKANSLKDEPIPYVKQTNIRWRITDAFPNGGDKTASFPPEQELKESYEYNGATYNTGLATGGGIYLRHTWGSTIPTYYSNPQTNQTAYAWTWVYSPVAQTVGAQIEFQNYGRSEKDLAPASGTWDYKGSRVWVNDTEILPPTWNNSGKSITNEVDLLNENFTARPVTTINLQQGWNKVFLKLPYIALSSSTVRLNKWMFTFVLTDTEGKNAVDGLIYSPNKTLDVASEQVVATIDEINTFVESVVGTEPGYYPESTAKELLAVVAAVEATLDQEKTEAERLEQVTQLQAAFDDFKDTYQDAGVNMPKLSNDTEVHYYTLKTPNRENRYLTSRGTSNTLVGNVSASDASYWRFEERADGTYNIINYSDGTYLNPSSASNNAAMTPSSSEPSQGWELQISSQIGLFIVTSGTTVELNQTTSTHNYQIFNWGWENGVANKSDDGCLYELSKVEDISTPDSDTELVPAYTAVDLELDGSGPIRVEDEFAQSILSADEVTIVVDYTLAEADFPYNSDDQVFYAFTGASNETMTEPYLAAVIQNHSNKGMGLKYASGGYQYTRKITSTFAGSHHVAYVIKSSGFDLYFDDVLVENGHIDANVLFTEVAPAANALFIGGMITSDNANKFPFKGTIHSIRYYTKALSATEIAGLTYDNLAPTPTDFFAVTFGGSENGTFKIQSEGEDITSGDEILYGTILTVVATPNDGYRLNSITVNGTAIEGNTFTVSGTTEVVVTFREDSGVEYSTPTGSIHSGNTTYVERIRTEGAEENVDQSWTSAPGSVYQLVNQTVLIQPGTTFNLYLDAYAAGGESSTTIYQDLRYTRAYIYTDWDRDGAFTQEVVYGIAGSDMSASSSPNNVLANYNTVMAINHSFTIPANASLGESRIRVIYHNAWRELNNGANSTNIEDGMAYDIVVKVYDPSGIGELEGESNQLYYANGKIYAHAEGAIAVYDLSGKLVRRAQSAPVAVDDLANGVYIVKVNDATLKFVK